MMSYKEILWYGFCILAGNNVGAYLFPKHSDVVIMTNSVLIWTIIVFLVVAWTNDND